MLYHVYWKRKFHEAHLKLIRKQYSTVSNYKSLQQQNLGRRFGTSKMKLIPKLAYAAFLSTAVVLLLLIYCLFVAPIVCLRNR